MDKLVNTGIQGIELNFSCPNVITKNSERTNLTIGVLKEIRKHCLLPISLKLPATFADMDFLEQLQDEINGITVSNAHIGLLPPEIKKNKIFSAFDKTEVWCPTGIYGPQERMLTYYSLYKFSRMVKRKGWSIASVGGYMTGEHVFQAILLGADVVQMSSAVAWKGLAVFRSSNCELEKCVNMIGEEDVQSVKRIAVDSVFKNADSVKGYMNDRKAVVTVNCKRCKVCQCCERFCIAITQNSEKEVCIDSSLCSGCGWCVQSCKHHGIQFE